MFFDFGCAATFNMGFAFACCAAGITGGLDMPTCVVNGCWGSSGMLISEEDAEVFREAVAGGTTAFSVEMYVSPA